MSETLPAGRVIKTGRGRREDLIACGSCGDTFPRPKGETYGSCLKCEIEYWLAQAGITPDDPGLNAIAEHNAIAFAKLADRSARAANAQGVIAR